MKRFWGRAEAVAGGAGWEVRLDDKPLRLPGGARLSLPTAALAQAVAQEWQQAGQGQGSETALDHQPLTGLAGTLQVRVAPDPQPVALAVTRYGESDLLCYRAEAPAPLVRRQGEAWDPWLAWLAQRHGIALTVTTGVMHVPQDGAALAALGALVAAQPPSVLVGLGVAVPALGSVVLGLALAEGALAADLAYDLAVIEEAFQAEIWGHDTEAQARRDAVRAEVRLAARFMALCRP